MEKRVKTNQLNPRNIVVQSIKLKVIALSIMQHLEDIKIWCESNKGTCAGLISVFILLILIISTEKSCGNLIAVNYKTIFFQSFVFFLKFSK